MSRPAVRLLPAFCVCALTLPLQRRRRALLGSGHAGRLPEGRRHEPVDRPARPAGARPALTAVADADAPVLWTGVLARRRQPCWSGSGNDGQVLQRRARRRVSRPSSTRPSSRSTRWRARRAAGSTSARRPTGGSTRSTRPASPRRSSIPKTSTSGRWRVDADGARLRGHRRQGRSSTDHARRQGRGLLSHEGDARAQRCCVAADGDLLAGTESPGRVFRVDPRRRRVPAARFGPAGSQRAAARARRRRLRRRAHRAVREDRPGAPIVVARAVAPDARAVGLDRDHVDDGGRPSGPSASGPAARRASRAAPAARAPSIASSPMASGTRSGRRPTTRPTTSPSTATARCWSPRAARARSIASPATRAQTTLLARAPAQQVTTIIADRDRGVLLADGESRPRSSACRRRPAATGIVRVGGPRRRVGGHVGHDQLARDAAGGHGA